MAETITCPGCYGSGCWQTECCDGSGGCSCGGGLVDMGRCNVCGGYGRVTEGEFNARANVDVILNGGYCFAGSGPTSGYWADKPAYGASRG